MTRYMTIKEAAATSGLPIRTFYNGCRDGTIPHIMSGNKYYVNYALFMEDMDRKSRENGGKADA